MLDARSVMATLAVTDVEKAKEFYGGTLGLKKADVKTIGVDVAYALKDGSQLYVYEREAPPKTDVTACSFLVEDFDRAVRELKGAGVTLEDYDLPGLKTTDGVAELDGTKAAWFKDPFGNILSVSELPR